MTGVFHKEKKTGKCGHTHCVLPRIFLFKVWIAGWKQRDHPNLHNAFHIGDRIISVNGLPVANAASAQKMIKHCKNETETITLLIQRIPHGKPLMIKRNREGESLGMIREGNTAEIRQIERDGLAAVAGLSSLTPSPVASSTATPVAASAPYCTWTITEINARHLNLFFKDDEIRDRLNAVGREISMVVQPTDFIKVLKRGLKKIKDFKDYIVQ